MRPLTAVAMLAVMLGGCATSDDPRSLSRGWPPACGRVLGGCVEPSKAASTPVDWPLWVEPFGFPFGPRAVDLTTGRTVPLRGW